MPTLDDINAASAAQFMLLLGGVFEHSAWVAGHAFASRPFVSADALHDAMAGAVRQAGAEQQLALIRAHPELAGREAVAGTLTVDSAGEQGRLGLTALPRAEFERMTRINAAYRDKFGFPCIVALKLHATRDSVLAEMERRLSNDRDTEIANALAQISHITRARIDKLLEAG
jgi:chitin deacetylase